MLSLLAARAEELRLGSAARRGATDARRCAGLDWARVRHARTWTKTTRTSGRPPIPCRQACHCSFVFLMAA
eukprot:scaffold4763_cov133-Isochrysis_galbana.AAC.2